MRDTLRRCVLLLLAVGALASPALAADSNSGKIIPIISLLLADKSSKTVLDDAVIPVDDPASGQIVSVVPDSAGDSGALVLTGQVAEDAHTGSVLLVQPGVDTRFPLGFAGQVTGVIDNANGTKTVTLEKVAYADVIEQASLNLDDIPLTASNFVGVIAPSGVESASADVAVMSRSAEAETGQQVYSFRDGAIVVREPASTDASTPLPMARMDVISAGVVSLNIKVDLVKMGDGVKASTMQPIDVSTPVGFVITGELDDIKLTKDIDFGLPGGLKELKLRLDGNLNVQVGFNGRGSATFGYFSQAWNEVKDETVKLLGVDGKVFGLAVDDKIGKYPLAGLVWSVPCPNTCPVVTGATQTPLRQAKAMGVIVWLYLTLDGELTLDGSLDVVRINDGSLSLGAEKVPGGKLVMIKSLQANSTTARLIEAPSFNGSVGLSLFSGFSADVDFFASGIYLANAGMDVGFKGNLGVNGNLSYGTNGLYAPWSWQGDACFNANYGAGALFRTGARFGVKIDTDWKDISGDFSYQWQVPTDSDMDVPGWHGAWFTADGTYQCTVSKLNDTGITWGGDYPEGNNATCTRNIDAPQDCHQGRDATHNDNSDGHGGFNFTKLDANGNSLSASAATWSCVRDNVTSLVWEVKTDDGGIHDRDNTYRWGGKTALGTGYGTYYPDWDTLVDGSNTERLCGYSDWRVPTRAELQGLVHYGSANPAIDTNYFPNTPMWEFWSASPGMSSDQAWSVDFGHGRTDSYAYHFNFNHVRLVRSGQ